MTSPATKAMRHAMSPCRGLNRPPSTPLIPAMRPLISTNIAAAMPMSTPPASADHGVKAFQSIDMAAARRLDARNDTPKRQRPGRLVEKIQRSLVRDRWTDLCDAVEHLLGTAALVHV